MGGGQREDKGSPGSGSAGSPRQDLNLAEIKS